MNEITVADPDEHLGLPGWIYSNPRFFAVECERVFAPWGVIIIRSAREFNEGSRGNGCVRVMPLG